MLVLLSLVTVLFLLNRKEITNSEPGVEPQPI